MVPRVHRGDLNKINGLEPIILEHSYYVIVELVIASIKSRIKVQNYN